MEIFEQDIIPWQNLLPQSYTEQYEKIQHMLCLHALSLLLETAIK